MNTFFNKGFTLIELMVVIAIIGVLSAVILPSLNEARMKSRDTRRISEIKQISTALELYYLDNNVYPPTQADSRNPPNLLVPPYLPLVSALVPKYLPTKPLPPYNNSGDGAMCGNCDEYFYMPNSNATGYTMCTYVAVDKNKNGSTVFGPTYCVVNNCGPGAGLAWCP